MPRKNYRRRAGIKKNYQKRKRTYRKKRNLVVAIAPGNQQLPLPNRMLVKMRYCQQLYLDASSSSASTWTFALNGLFDPDVTATGHQPMGFDQFSALYQYYKVLGTRVRLEACGATITTTSENYVGIQFHENLSYVPSDIMQIVERGREVHRLLGNQTNQAKLAMNWSAKKWYGKKVYSGYDTAGSIAANPSELAYCSVFVTRAENHENPDGLSLLLTFDYIVEWFGPLQMNQS